MHWAMLIAGSLIAVVLLVAVIGLCLPRTHVVSRKILLRQAPSTLFNTIMDWQAYPTWRDGISSVKVWTGPDGASGWVESSRFGAIPLQILESSPPHKLVVKIADPKLPFSGIWTYEIQAAADGSCSVCITEQGEVFNPIFRFISRFLMGHTATMDSYLRSLARKYGQEFKPATE